MLIATILLGISIVGLTVLMSAKAWELRSGKKFFSPVRGKMEMHASRITDGVRADLPKSAARVARLSGRLLRAYTSLGLAKLLVVFEHGLEKTLRKVRTAPRELERRGEASAFLREVAAYKRMLSREPVKEERESDKMERATDSVQ